MIPIDEERLRAFKDKKNRLMGRLLNKSYRMVTDLAVKFLTQKGYEKFRLGHIVALVHIELEGANVMQLAQKAGMTKQGMSKLIKELMEEGYVRTEKDPEDARALLVKLTDKGVQFLSDWIDCSEHINNTFASIVGQEKLEVVKDILSELVDNYEKNCLSPLQLMDYQALQRRLSEQ